MRWTSAAGAAGFRTAARRVVRLPVSCRRGPCAPAPPFTWTNKMPRARLPTAVRRTSRGSGFEPTPREAWTWIPVPLLRSPLFQAIGINTRRACDFLHCELAKRPKANGDLPAPYEGLEAFGATGADISHALREGQVVGLWVVTFEAPRIGAGGEPSRYRLTYRQTWEANGWVSPTNDWRAVAEELSQQGLRDVRGIRAWLRDTVPKRRPSSPR
jgi:hypothetical protein